MSIYIKKLIENGENVHLDFKQVIQNPNKIAKSIVSFANTSGGTLLVGVRDNGSIAGINSEEEFHMVDMIVNFYIKPTLNFNTKSHLIEGKQILEVIIPEGDNKPYYSKGEDNKWWVYVRVMDKCILASKTTVDFMHSIKKESTVQMGKTELSILNYLKENEKITHKQVCNYFNLGKRRASQLLISLMRVQAIRSHTTEKEEFYTLYQ